ncbi:MAG: SDR family NAD(P)-dependent oxidoreductase, partial [Streptococcus suis]
MIMSDWLNIHDKVYVVTGGSSGIGLAIVEGLLEQGAKVANLDIRDSDLTHERLLFIETN